MLLDYVLTMPDAEWFATADDNVALFTRELGVRATDLPQHVYAPADRLSPVPGDDPVLRPEIAGLPHRRSVARALRLSRQ